ncbi:hypothetical protein PSHT_11809 [Puccinia striiformis]|uniref:Uncharacterized protein n=1 Tax=Puccinia striiformis TaxID=27350 RepID=A0A2S4V0T3_9BASI|nr:hypothetical protein PSHT_11809 [Puccinia striiformis]
MRHVSLLAFFAQFPLRNSLPMESGVLTKFTASSGRSFEGQSHASDLTNGLTTSAHELADTKSAGMSPDTQAGNLKNLDDALPTPWGNHRSLKPIDWNQPRTPASSEEASLTSSPQTLLGTKETFTPPKTSSDDVFSKNPGSPSSQSSKSQEVSLSDEWKHTSPKAASPKETSPAPTSPTSEYAKQIQSLYRQVLSAIEKPQARLQKTKYWQKFATYVDEMKTHPLFDREPVVLHFDPDDKTKLTEFLKRAGQNLIPQDKRVLNEYYKAFSASDKGLNARVHSDPDTYIMLSKWEKKNFIPRGIFRDYFETILPEGETFRRESALQIQREQFRILAGWEKKVASIRQATGYGDDEINEFGNLIGGKVFPLSFDHSNFKESLAKLKSLNRAKPRIASQWEQYLGKQEYESRIGLLKTMSRMKDPDRIPVETIAGWRAQGLDVDRMLKIVDYTPNGRQIGDEAHQFADFHFTNPAERQSARNLFLPDNLYGIPWLKSLEHSQLLQTSPETKLKYLNFHSKVQLPDRPAPPPPLILPAEPVLPSQPMLVPQKLKAGSWFTKPFQNQRLLEKFSKSVKSKPSST